jgi:hypothetical protein
MENYLWKFKEEMHKPNTYTFVYQKHPFDHQKKVKENLASQRLWKNGKFKITKGFRKKGKSVFEYV